MGHFGVTRMKHLARRFVWWPGLDAELEALARDCPACAAKRAAPPHATRHPWEPTDGPWERVHADFAGPLFGHYFLVMVDSYTKWIEAVAMKSTTATRTVAVMREVFARLGLPTQLVTDNGPQFTSQEFAAFMQANSIRHIRTAPYHPSSNGQGERAVGVMKNALRTSAAAGGGLDLALARALLAYRVTPHAVTGRAPAEMMFGRNLRTRLNALVPSADADLRAAADRQRQGAGGRHREFALGATVWARNYSGSSKWMRGTVAARSGPVSYEIDVGSALWSRHVDQLLAAEAAEGADSRPTSDIVDRDDTAGLRRGLPRATGVGSGGEARTTSARDNPAPVDGGRAAVTQREVTRGGDGGSPTSDRADLEGPRGGDSRPSTGVDGASGQHRPVVPADWFGDGGSPVSGSPNDEVRGGASGRASPASPDVGRPVGVRRSGRRRKSPNRLVVGK